LYLDIFHNSHTFLYGIEHEDILPLNSIAEGIIQGEEEQKRKQEAEVQFKEENRVLVQTYCPLAVNSKPSFSHLVNLQRYLEALINTPVEGLDSTFSSSEGERNR